MAEGAVETSKARPSEALLRGRIEFHPARRPLSTANAFHGRDPRMEALNPSPGSHRPATASGAPSSSMAGRRSDGGEFHQRGLDPELSFEITFRRIGAGLANLGNTCFLNSVLQCLTYTEPFAAYLKSGKHKSSSLPAPPMISKDLSVALEQVEEAFQGEETDTADNGNLSKGEVMDILAPVESFMESQESETARLIGMSDEGVNKGLKPTLL